MIIASAIKHKGVVYPGKRHDDCIRTITKIFNFDEKLKEDGFQNQGFIDERGNFYDRRAAAKLAIACGQIKKLRYHQEELFSEDLW